MLAEFSRPGCQRLPDIRMEITPHTLLEYYQVAFGNLTYRIAFAMRPHSRPNDWRCTAGRPIYNCHGRQIFVK